MTTPDSVTIVGGGLAGVSTAAALRSHGYDGKVSILEAGDAPYDRPPLSKDYLTGRVDQASIELQPTEWYEANDVELVTRTRAVALRPHDGGVQLSTGRVLRADRVVLATGGLAARPPVPGAEGPRVHVLRSVEDADGLRGAAAPGARALIVGAGLIGAEVASSLLTLGLHVTVVEATSTPLLTVAGAPLAQWLHDMHAQHGVELVTGSVQRLEDLGGAVRVTVLAPSTADLLEFQVDLVVLGVGMAPQTALAQSAGLRTHRGILVDACQRSSNPAVFAVGDTARPVVAGIPQTRAEHWEAAKQDGARAAATIVGGTPPIATAPWFWSDRYGHHLEIAGSMGAADTIAVRGELGAAPFAVFGLAGGRVVAAAAVDDSLAVRAGRRLIDRAVEVDPGALADPDTSLRLLART